MIFVLLDALSEEAETLLSKWVEDFQMVTISRLLPTDVELDIPTDVAVCPYCQAKLVATFSAWSLHTDGEWVGKWKADEVDLDCENSSDDDHYVMPYVYQLPVDEKVLAWVNAKYSFNCDD